MLRMIRRSAIALAVLAMAIQPAAAAGVMNGNGVITGTVLFTPGFNCLQLVDDQAWTFQSVVFTGVFNTSDRGVIYLTDMTANASGNSIVENCAGGVGSVNSFTATGVGTTPGGIGFMTITINMNGVYVRDGADTHIALTGAVTVCSEFPVFGGCSTYTTAARSDGVLLPNQTPPAIITSATYAGTWEATGVSA